MAGIYIHIPFCKSKCIYCDFYSITNSNNIEKYVDAICKETTIRKNYLQAEKIESIYFGGGTPSLLDVKYINRIIQTIQSNFTITNACEITIEVNPDDISENYAIELKLTSINRISIGIQSFNDDELRMLNRRHDSSQAINAVKILQKNGLDNISVDLIYGLPGSSLKSWKNSIFQAINLNVQHISAYHLTYEKGTPLFKSYKAKKTIPIEEDLSISQFELLIDALSENDYEQYEISNFSKIGFASIHNSNYWKQKKYLGTGASAHSYDIESRQWNVSNAENYIDAINNESVFFEKEILSITDKYNDYILTSLRTKWGGSVKYMESNFGEKFVQHFVNESKKYIDDNLLVFNKDNFKLSRKGIFISDTIMTSLLYV